MNPLEALQLLINAASMARLTKPEHVQVEQAAKVLHDTIQTKDKKQTPSKTAGG